MTTENLLPARAAAEFLGCAQRAKSGKRANHTAFLHRLRAQFPDTFPTPHWTRTGLSYYAMNDLERFKQAMPREAPPRPNRKLPPRRHAA